MIKKQPTTLIKFIKNAYTKLLSCKPLPFAEMTPQKVPEKPGVYMITACLNGKEESYYVGRSTNLRRRLYKNHLMGAPANARLKKYLVESRECANYKSAKNFICRKCVARWLQEPDLKKRGAIEGFVTAILRPKYGISHEH
jgi:hypothetical protein